MFRKHQKILLLASLLTVSASSTAATIAFTDEASYMAALGSYAYNTSYEGFENDAAWGSVRSTIIGGFNTATSITSNGINWSSNTSNGGITTGNGAALYGNWGVYSYPHGDYTNHLNDGYCNTPGNCGDGFTGTSASTLYGIGGWITTNTPFASIALFIDGASVDFGETCDLLGDCIGNDIIGSDYSFFGVINTAGFNGFEFREMEGTLGDAKYIFADDFIIATAVTPVPVPAALPLFSAGLGLIAFLARRKK